ncbi:MAG: acyltransferase [Acidobacteriaceae bacterium]|nr:acyltransferase [Acidobacteriaceae bacterium]
MHSSAVVRKPSALPGFQGHLAALDGVRGIALLMVLAVHFLWSTNTSANPFMQAFLDLKGMAWSGVYLFFALSGFLITGILYDSLGAQHYLRTFWARRVLRIFPLYYGVLLLLLLLTKPLHFQWHGQMWMLWLYLNNLPFSLNFNSNPAPYINLIHFWSLAVEEQFYLFWPIVVLTCKTPKRILLAALIGCLISIAARWLMILAGVEVAGHSLLCNLDAILLGGMLAILVRTRLRDKVLQAAPYLFLFCTTTVLWMVLRPEYFRTRDVANFDLNHNPLFGVLGMTLLSIGMTALIGMTLQPGSPSNRFFSSSFLRFFGRYSYGAYVLHYSIDSALTDRLRRALLHHGVPAPLNLLVAAIPLIALSMAVAYASYHLYEKHFLALKKYFPYKRAPLQEPATL